MASAGVGAGGAGGAADDGSRPAGVGEDGLEYPAVAAPMPVLDGMHADLDKFLLRPSPFGSETGELPMGEYEAGGPAKALVHDAKILVIGAGGLGCELLKDLALSGFRDIHVIDLDSIDLTNLNRQFLFRERDIGHSKAFAAARFIQERIPGVKVTPHHKNIMSMPDEFYQSFKVIIGGLDNVNARRWINARLCSYVEVDEDGDPVDPDQIIPFVDGGTEALKGQARVIIPRLTSCFECSIDAFPPQTGYAFCTIAKTPRKPEHCIAYAVMVEWRSAFKPDSELPKPPAPNTTFRAIDTDSPDDMKWLYERAVLRAAEFGIEGVDYMLTMGVVKRIIPAIASTNAIIAAACVNEVLKLVSFASCTMNNYYMYMANTGVYTSTFNYERKTDCVVCHRQRILIPMTATSKLSEVIEFLKARLQATNPTVSRGGSPLYAPKGPLAKMTKDNLERTMAELDVKQGDEIGITDEVFTLPVVGVAQFSD